MTVNETVTTSTQGAAKATVSKSDRVARILQNCYELRSSHYADKVKAEELLASSWEEHHADYALTPAIIEDLLRARRCCQATTTREANRNRPSRPASRLALPMRRPGRARPAATK